jgi:hypothetical protein
VSYSETFALALNLYRHYRAVTTGLPHKQIDLEELDIAPPASSSAIVPPETLKYVKRYESRLLGLIDIARKSHIDPVLITQPALYGSGTDDVTGVDLGRIRVGETHGEHRWQILELYNDATRRVGTAENVLVIDLAKEVPKSSKYFYDFYHFTNDGAKKVGDIVYSHFSKYLKANYREYLQEEPARVTAERPGTKS